jgi:hypothetical protein
MNANERESLNTLFEAVVGAAYEVSNTLGAGFLRKGLRTCVGKGISAPWNPCQTTGSLPGELQGARHR